MSNFGCQRRGVVRETGTVAAKLDRLGDRAMIADQMYRYARATDWLQTDLHRDVFETDCVFASPHSGDIHGIDAVVSWMEAALGRFEATQHLIGNIAVEFAGEVEATAVSSVRAWHRWVDRSQPDMVLWGEYHDRWRLTDTWRIAERRVLEAGIEPFREGGARNPRRRS